jgi:hypothetical protein
MPHPPKKKAKNDNNTKQISLNELPSLVIKHKYSRYIGVDLLMTDVIYGARVWSKEEDRDDVEFWEQQKQEFLHDNPTYVFAVAALEDEEEKD